MGRGFIRLFFDEPVGICKQLQYSRTNASSLAEHVQPVAFQFLCQPPGIAAAETIQCRPEGWAVVFVSHVRQLMQQQIVLQMPRQEDHIDVQAQIVLRRAASPAGLLAAKRSPAVGQLMLA